MRNCPTATATASLECTCTARAEMFATGADTVTEPEPAAGPLRSSTNTQTPAQASRNHDKANHRRREELNMASDGAQTRPRAHTVTTADAPHQSHTSHENGPAMTVNNPTPDTSAEQGDYLLHTLSGTQWTGECRQWSKGHAITDAASFTHALSVLAVTITELGATTTHWPHTDVHVNAGDDTISGYRPDADVAAIKRLTEYIAHNEPLSYTQTHKLAEAMTRLLRHGQQRAGHHISPAPSVRQWHADAATGDRATLTALATDTRTPRHVLYRIAARHGHDPAIAAALAHTLTKPHLYVRAAAAMTEHNEPDIADITDPDIQGGIATAIAAAQMAAAAGRDNETFLTAHTHPPTHVNAQATHSPADSSPDVDKPHNEDTPTRTAWWKRLFTALAAGYGHTRHTAAMLAAVTAWAANVRRDLSTGNRTHIHAARRDGARIIRTQWRALTDTSPSNGHTRH